MTDDHVLGAGFLQHRAADLTGERAFALPVQVLPGHADVEFRAASATEWSAVKGGATTISTSAMSFTRLRNSLTNTTASCTVLCIFQFAAMNGVRMVI